MPLTPASVLDPEGETRLVARARSGDQDAMARLVEPWRKPLFAYLYRMVTHRHDAEDLLQEVMVRAIDGIRDFRGDGRFKSWLFGIATHVALDHLRRRKRWRVDTQLEAEAAARADDTRMTEIRRMAARADFRFEIREHVAFCFSCVARSLEPEAQAALLLREVFSFSAIEGASALGMSEPRFRHRLAAARRHMIEAYDGMCQLINKTGACWQCRGLRDLAPPANQGADLVSIELGPGVAVNSENLFDARLDIVRSADLEEGATQKLHEDFFAAVTGRVESYDES